jgi:glycosyltransferase involved in cell wall biosynthesis
MPNAILEAMAAGKAVVATQVHGVAELLFELVMEQTVPRDQPAAFRERLVALLRDPEQCQALGTRNQERAIQQFSIGNCVAKYEDLYSQIARAQASKKI